MDRSTLAMIVLTLSTHHSVTLAYFQGFSLMASGKTPPPGLVSAGSGGGRGGKKKAPRVLLPMSPLTVLLK